jgi:hypothetical protein
MARRLFVPAKSKDLQNTQAYELAFSIANEIGSLHVKSTEEFLHILERFF